MPMDVTVHYQQKAWFDSHTSMMYAKNFASQIGTAEEKLLWCDNLGSQTNPRFKKFIRENTNSLLIYTPEGCTDVCAVTDHNLGKSVKDRMRAMYQKNFEDLLTEWVDGEFSISEVRRSSGQMALSCVERISNRREDQIERAFKHCGLLNACDGSEDKLIKPPGIENYEMGE